MLITLELIVLTRGLPRLAFAEVGFDLMMKKCRGRR